MQKVPLRGQDEINLSKKNYSIEHICEEVYSNINQK